MDTIEEQKNTGIFAPALKYGVLTAIALIAMTLFVYFAGFITASWTSWIGYGILLAGIIIGTLAYRNEYLGGYISYGRALGYGTLTIFFASVIHAIFGYIFYNYLAPDALEQLRIAAEVQILEVNPNIADQELDLAMKFVSPGLLAVSSILSYTFIGFIISLITSASLKKKDPLEV